LLVVFIIVEEIIIVLDALSPSHLSVRHPAASVAAAIGIVIVAPRPLQGLVPPMGFFLPSDPPNEYNHNVGCTGLEETRLAVVNESLSERFVEQGKCFLNCIFHESLLVDIN
jgi:hypothetical protein